MVARSAKRSFPVLHYMLRWLPLSEQFVYGLVRGSRHRSIVVSRFAPENLTAFPFRPIVNLQRLPVRRLGSPAERRLLTASLMLLAPATRARVLHVHHGYRVHDVEGAARRMKIRLVVSFHGQDLAVLPRETGRDMYKGVLRHADAVIVPSRFLVDYATAAGARDESVHVIPSGVDLRWFTPTPLPDGAPEVLFVGRFVEKKGVDVLLQAWPQVRARVPNARLRLLGIGPLAPPADHEEQSVVIEPADPLKRAEQVRDAIRAARVVVTPSRTAADGDVESLLLVNLEAQASGRPLVSTRHGGIPEFVDDGETALLVPENDASALADALIRVLEDDELAARMASSGPAWVRRFDVERCIAEVDQLYDSIAGV